MISVDMQATCSYLLVSETQLIFSLLEMCFSSPKLCFYVGPKGEWSFKEQVPVDMFPRAASALSSLLGGGSFLPNRSSWLLRRKEPSPAPPGFTPTPHPGSEAAFLIL